MKQSWFLLIFVFVVTVILWTAPVPAQADQSAPDDVITTINFQYSMNDGSSGSGSYFLADNGAFVDNNGDSGVWVYDPINHHYYIGYSLAHCAAFSLGTYNPVNNLIQGLRLCTDGSGGRGFWSGLLIASGVTTRVSVPNPAVQGNSISITAAISADGRYVAIKSFASNLVKNDINGTWDIFVYDRQTGLINRVSVASNGVQGNGPSYDPVLSANGRFVSFHSLASNLVSGDTNGTWDVFVHDRLTRQTSRVSIASDGTEGNGDSLFPSISADGQYVAFVSSAGNLVSGDTNGAYDIFVHDRQTGQTNRVSVASEGAQGNNFSSYPAISANGQHVTFSSVASNLVNGDDNAATDIFVHNQDTGQTSLISVASDGTQGNGYSAYSSVSADGRYITFLSTASNLVSDDTNGYEDIFVHDQQTGQTSRVSIASDGAQANGSSTRHPAISADGQSVVFGSVASNLVSGDTNGYQDIFVHNRQTGQTNRVSVASYGTQQGNETSYWPTMSADGQYVTFESDASNLVSDDTNNATDIFVHDRQTGQTSRVSTAGTQGNEYSSGPAISTDERYLAFSSGASNLVSGDYNATGDVFVLDRQTGQISLVSVASAGTQGDGASFEPAISADGRYVAFYSWASNLVSNDTNGQPDVFVHDRQTGQTSRASVASDGTQANGQSVEKPAIAADGRYVAFASIASNLVSGDTNGLSDVFVHDNQTGQTSRVSIASDGAQGNGDGAPAISADGRYVAFSAQVSLVGDDSNGKRDIYVHDRQTGQTSRVSIASDGTQGNDDTWAPPAISGDGRYVAFWSYASNLVSGDTNGFADVFVHDRQTGQTSRVSVASDGTEANGGSSYYPSISADGQYVVFFSDAGNLVNGDTNGVRDVFVHDRQTEQTSRVSVSSPGTQANDESQSAVISADGQYVAFQSAATNLVSGDTNGFLDVFVRDRGQ